MKIFKKQVRKLSFMTVMALSWMLCLLLSSFTNNIKPRLSLEPHKRTSKESTLINIHWEVRKIRGKSSDVRVILQSKKCRYRQQHCWVNKNAATKQHRPVKFAWTNNKLKVVATFTDRICICVFLKSSRQL